MRALALRLLAVEAAGQSADQSQVQAATRVCEKLRISLTRLAGADGFATLMRRALVLARGEVSSLHSVQLRTDGSLEGLEESARSDGEGGGDAAIAILAHLLGLLVTFVGESITLRLVREAWPTLDEQN